MTACGSRVNCQNKATSSTTCQQKTCFLTAGSGHHGYSLFCVRFL